MSRRVFWLMRLKQVETDLDAATLALGEFGRLASSDATVVPTHSSVRVSDFAPANERLKPLLMVAAVVSFEAALREFWSSALGRTTEPPLSALVASVASRRQVPATLVDQVGAVRNARNAFIHQGRLPDADFPQVRRTLARFLSHLPDDWQAA